MDSALTALLDELARFGDDNDARETERARRMLNITPETGRLLWILARSARATRILEVGTSNGYSTIWLADAARATGGRVTTLELNPAKVKLARENLARAGLADRGSYLTYLELVVPRLVPGGLLVADNVSSHAQELHDYLARVKSHPALLSVTVPVGKGEEISFKLG